MIGRSMEANHPQSLGYLPNNSMCSEVARRFSHEEKVLRQCSRTFLNVPVLNFKLLLSNLRTPLAKKIFVFHPENLLECKTLPAELIVAVGGDFGVGPHCDVRLKVRPPIGMLRMHFRNFDTDGDQIGPGMSYKYWSDNVDKMTRVFRDIEDWHGSFALETRTDLEDLYLQKMCYQCQQWDLAPVNFCKSCSRDSNGTFWCYPYLSKKTGGPYTPAIGMDMYEHFDKREGNGWRFVSWIGKRRLGSHSLLVRNECPPFDESNTREHIHTWVQAGRTAVSSLGIYSGIKDATEFRDAMAMCVQIANSALQVYTLSPAIGSAAPVAAPASLSPSQTSPPPSMWGEYNVGRAGSAIALPSNRGGSRSSSGSNLPSRKKTKTVAIPGTIQEEEAHQRRVRKAQLQHSLASCDHHWPCRKRRRRASFRQAAREGLLASSSEGHMEEASKDLSGDRGNQCITRRTTA